jgi:hypothetical protein
MSRQSTVIVNDARVRVLFDKADRCRAVMTLSLLREAESRLQQAASRLDISTLEGAIERSLLIEVGAKILDVVDALSVNDTSFDASIHNPMENNHVRSC